MSGLLTSLVQADIHDSFYLDRMAQGERVLDAKHTVRYKKDDTGWEQYLIYTHLQVDSTTYPDKHQNVYQLVKLSPTEIDRVANVKQVQARFNGETSNPGTNPEIEGGHIDVIASFEHVDVLVTGARNPDIT